MQQSSRNVYKYNLEHICPDSAFAIFLMPSGQKPCSQWKIFSPQAWDVLWHVMILHVLYSSSCKGSQKYAGICWYAVYLMVRLVSQLLNSWPCSPTKNTVKAKQVRAKHNKIRHHNRSSVQKQQIDKWLSEIRKLSSNCLIKRCLKGDETVAFHRLHLWVEEQPWNGRDGFQKESRTILHRIQWFSKEIQGDFHSKRFHFACLFYVHSLLHLCHQPMSTSSTLPRLEIPTFLPAVCAMCKTLGEDPIPGKTGEWKRHLHVRRICPIWVLAYSYCLHSRSFKYIILVLQRHII